MRRLQHHWRGLHVICRIWFYPINTEHSARSTYKKEEPRGLWSVWLSISFPLPSLSPAFASIWLWRLCQSGLGYLCCDHLRRKANWWHIWSACRHVVCSRSVWVGWKRQRFVGQKRSSISRREVGDALFLLIAPSHHLACNVKIRCFYALCQHLKPYVIQLNIAFCLHEWVRAIVPNVLLLSYFITIREDGAMPLALKSSKARSRTAVIYIIKNMAGMCTWLWLAQRKASHVTAYNFHLSTQMCSVKKGLCNNFDAHKPSQMCKLMATEQLKYHRTTPSCFIITVNTMNYSLYIKDDIIHWFPGARGGSDWETVDAGA